MAAIKEMKSFNRSRTLLLLYCGLLTALMNCAQAEPATTSYYVAPYGNNNNPGTIDKPFATLSKAVSIVKPGDTILMRDGTYKLKQGVWVGTSGTTDARIVIKSYPGETAILDGSGMPNDNDCITLGGGYIDINGINCRSATRAGINVWCGHNIRIVNNTISNAYGTGILSICNKPNVVRNIRVYDNTVYHNVLMNRDRTANGGWGTGMSIIGGSDITFSNNRVYENYGEGIGCFASVRCTVRNNTIYDNYSVQLYIANSANTIAQSNLIYTTGNTAFFRKINGVWSPATGIQLGDEGCQDATRVILNNIIVRNNIVVGGRSGFYYGNYACPDEGMKNTLITNNTFYGSSDALLYVDASIGSSSNTVANNIFYQINDNPMTTIADTKSLTYDRNLWYGGRVNTALRKGDIVADPQLISPGSTKATGYKLKLGSLAIDAGTAMNEVTTDYFGTDRPSGKSYDIGAYEFP